jgi:ketosteroid isomerase-like protein
MPSEEIVVIDDWAYERHFELLEIYEVGGEPTQYYLKGVRIFRRGEDGSWKVARYIWNGDVPPD